jgi:FAD dependent oxidoreductase
MLRESPAPHRHLKTDRLAADLVITGAGVAGCCCAITAARKGLKVVLIHDRPVPGGNASSEVRLWVLGATAHMGNNNRWAREGGVIDEILVENMYRNPEGNPLIFDTVLLEKLVKESNITLLLNTAVFEVGKKDADTIASVKAFCSQNSTMYEATAPLFVDSSGDGVVGFLAGAAFRMGAEPREEFGEKFAPDKAYGELLGHSIYFYSKDVGVPVKYVPPSFAIKDITQVIPRYREFHSRLSGCRLWWIEYGGRLDTVHQTEEIKWQLWKVVYGVWDYIKNSGKFADAENLTLEWVGTVPGKRESRRFEGDYMLTQHDVIGATHFDDAVNFGGWAIDLHPADGVFSELHGCTQLQAKSVYEIPYRTMYSRNITNLFLAGRIISVSHVAFGSTRVIGTCSHGAQAVAVAAAICREKNLLPRDIGTGENLKRLQCELTRIGQYIPNYLAPDPDDLVQHATVSASSTMKLAEFPADGPMHKLEDDFAQMFPVQPGPMPAITIKLDATANTIAKFQLRISSRINGHTPDTTLDEREMQINAGVNQQIKLGFAATIDAPRYVWLCISRNEHVSMQTSKLRVTGVLSVRHWYDQKPDSDIGVDTFEFWRPVRRPDNHNLAVKIEPPITAVFSPSNITTTPVRPTNHPNAWVADPSDPSPTLTLDWKSSQTIRVIDLSFDPDWDHPMESVLMGHPEREMPFCVKAYRLSDENGEEIFAVTDNHQARNRIELADPVVTSRLKLEITATHGAPAAVFAVRCF